MLRRIWQFLMDPRTLTVTGFAALAALLWLGAELLELALVWALAGFAAAVLLWLLAHGVRRWRARRASAGLGAAMQAESPSPASGAAAAREELKLIRAGMLAAIDTIRASRLGRVAGAAALYELPWYMVIGNPSAGKSSAITHSGLQFPITDGKIVQGVGGTRNCDWFFTTDAILLDTAGRYAVLEQHRDE